jgi:hypothetical protein
MTISTRLFGYAISISFDKAITVPIDKLSDEHAARTMQESSELQLQTNRLIATQPHDAMPETLAQSSR